jgi:hypothetical protein
MSKRTVLLIRSLEDSLAHWCTLSICDWSGSAEAHQRAEDRA